MKTYLPVPGAVPLWTSAKARRKHAYAYRVRSSGTVSSRSPVAMLKPRGIGLSGPEKRLSEITALEAMPEKPNRIAFDQARRVLELAELFAIEPNQVTASAEGGVALCYKIDGMYADIECFNSGEIWGIISDRINPASAWAVENSSAGIGAALIKIKSGLNA